MRAGHFTLPAAGCLRIPGGEPGWDAPEAAATVSLNANQTGDSNILPVTGATLQAADDPELGEISVDSQGMTLYSFEIDTATENMCVESDCVAVWPSLIVNGEPQAGNDVTGDLTTISRPDGSQQAAFAGHPLYTFTLDQNPGDTAGDGIDEFGGVWHALTPSGEEVGSGTSGGDPVPPAN